MLIESPRWASGASAGASTASRAPSGVRSRATTRPTSSTMPVNTGAGYVRAGAMADSCRYDAARQKAAFGRRVSPVGLRKLSQLGLEQQVRPDGPRAEVAQPWRTVELL